MFFNNTEGIIMTDTHLLRYIISKNGDTTEELADYLGIKRSTLSAKINNKSSFKVEEMVMIIKRYKMTYKEVDETFIKE